jgi:hypothetical protein
MSKIAWAPAALLALLSTAISAEPAALEFVRQIAGGHSAIRNSGSEPVIITDALFKDRPECAFDLVIGQDRTSTPVLLDRDFLNQIDKMRGETTGASDQGTLAMQQLAYSFRRAEPGNEPSLLPGDLLPIASTGSPCHGSAVSKLEVHTSAGSIELDAAGWR